MENKIKATFITIKKSPIGPYPTWGIIMTNGQIIERKKNPGRYLNEQDAENAAYWELRRLINQVRGDNK